MDLPNDKDSIGGLWTWGGPILAAAGAAVGWLANAWRGRKLDRATIKRGLSQSESEFRIAILGRLQTTETELAAQRQELADSRAAHNNCEEQRLADRSTNEEKGNGLYRQLNELRIRVQSYESRAGSQASFDLTKPPTKR
jgi:hypothetical protein